MHIGVDATCWLLPRGFGRHTRCLLTALRAVDTANGYTFFTDSPRATAEVAAIARVHPVRISASTQAGAAARSRRTFRDLIAMSRAMSEPSIDVLLFPTVYSYVPVVSRARKVMLFHDVTAERFPHLTLDGWRSRVFWNAKIALARRQADVMVTVSEYSRQALAQQFGIDIGRLHVVGEASDPVFRRLDHPQLTRHVLSMGLTGERRAVVYVGGFSPHKNLPGLVDAFGRLVKDTHFDDVDLVLVGDYEHETFFTCYQEVRARVERMGLDRRVIFTGFLADEDLVALLNLATVLVLPSMTEGFGLPAIEAAACGCPVIATSESPLPELLGEGGVFIDPNQLADLDRALRLVLTSPGRQADMRQAGLAAASRLTWTAAARELVRLMERAVAQ